MTVYGTVIPWSHEREPDGTLRLWDVHGAELGRQAAEWRALIEVGPLCVAGDFNQAWTRGGYGTRALREAHHRAADRAGLACLTAAESANDIPVIDHVLLSRDWADQHSARVSLTWPGRRADGLHMSDHPGVAIDLLAASPSR